MAAPAQPAPSIARAAQPGGPAAKPIAIAPPATTTPATLGPYSIAFSLIVSIPFLHGFLNLPIYSYI